MTEVLEAQRPQKGLKKALQRLRNRKSRRGLTLVELAIVLLVLGVIIGIVYANLDTGAVDNAKITMFPAQAAQLEMQWKQYENRVGQVPEGNSLQVLAQNDRENGWEAIDEKTVTDMWGNPYFICMSQQGYREICTYGADGQPGGEGENADFYVSDKTSWPAWLKR
ncbi:MAG TPA: hypothetical protein DEA96_07460 [Leptospiraceae bacterium]|nr:hypothetical protein [Spirochaetaceae bacterium]HBS04783.1 hypothetical protein [Leptospiraceae bacterium]|tara:strand:- start:14619 stop:15116 length:498 start_codon:yes stop_codon:yes gene_type:complete